VSHEQGINHPTLRGENKTTEKTGNGGTSGPRFLLKKGVVFWEMRKREGFLIKVSHGATWQKKGEGRKRSVFTSSQSRFPNKKCLDVLVGS